jgi:hypothetical protein
MGRGKRRALALIAAAAALLCVAAAPSLYPLREARWLKSDDLAVDLSEQPSECRSHYPDKELERSAEIGRIAFRAPLLLGGQAARAGLSCSTCHSNGRSNTHFHFPGLSAAPGTADVTSSIMSSHRGDGIFNPVPIPDLAGDPRKLKISRDPSGRALEKFIHGLITEEFDGPEPPNAVLNGLAAYVRSLSPSQCREPSVTPVTLALLLHDVDEAIELARQSFANGDQASGRLLIGAARSTLGTIDERYNVPSGTRVRSILAAASTELGSIEVAGEVEPGAFDEWRRKWPGRVRELRVAEPASLFSKAVLRRALQSN